MEQFLANTKHTKRSVIMANVKRLERLKYLVSKTTYVTLGDNYGLWWPYPNKRAAYIDPEMGDIVRSDVPKEQVDRRIRYLISRVDRQK